MNISVSNLIDNATRPGTVDPLEAALVGEWPLADNGTKSKGPVDATLHAGAAYEFDSTNFLSGFSAVSITGVYTWATSIMAPTGAAGGVGLRGGSGGDKYGLQIDVAGAELQMYTGSGSTTIIASLSLDTWYRVVGVYDGTTYRLYVNGSEISNTTTGGGGLELSDIGGTGSSANECYMGKIEVYSAAWDSDDVTYDLNNSEVGLFAFDRAGTSLTYADAELIYIGVEASTAVRDFSSNVNNGTLAAGYQTPYAPQGSYCIQIVNYRDGLAQVGAGRTAYWAFPDPDDPTQGLTGVAITRPKKTAPAADEGMNFLCTPGGGGMGAVAIPQDAAFTPDGANGFSLSYWIYSTAADPAPLGGMQFVMSDATFTNYSIAINDASGVVAYEVKGALTNAKNTTAATLVAGWNHLCLTYDGTSEVILYLNGASSGTTTATLGTVTQYPMVVGNRISTDAFFGCGRMMNWVGWYDRELTAVEVSTVYNARLAVHP